MAEPILVRYSDDSLLQEYSLSRLIRYNNRPRLQDENVAVHSFFVTLFALRILDDLSATGHVDEGMYANVLSMAVLHDVGEVVTSDVPYDVKHASDVIAGELVKLEREYLSEQWPVSFQRANELHMEDELTYDYAHAILKLADTYSVLQYCAHEVDLGNATDVIKDIYEDAEERCERWRAGVLVYAREWSARKSERKSEQDA